MPGRADLPHIILIILDSTRSDMLGCYGSRDGLTPNIDALAEKGTVLRNHYSASCGSAASHVSIFTGQHPFRHKMLHNLCELSPRIVAMPSLLAKLGYRSFGHCKMSFIPPVGYADLFGFEELRYPGDGGRSISDSWTGRVMSRIRFSMPLYLAMKKAYRLFSTPERQIRVSSKLQDGMASIQYILSKMRDGASSGPVFAYSTILHPHLPCCAPKPFLDAVFEGKKPHPDAFKIQLNVHGFANGDFGMADEALDSLRNLYKADVMYADHLVGLLCSGLMDEGVFENTMLIITSDHGELLGEHGCINHGAMVWEELFRTPCVIHWPDGPSARIVDGLTSGMDIVPTIFDMMGRIKWLMDRTTFDGLPVHGGGRHVGRNLVVDSPPAVLPNRYRKFPRLLEQVNVIRRVTRTGKHKYVWQSKGGHMLYDIQADPGEENNVIGQSKKLAGKLHSRMLSFYKSIDPSFEIGEYTVPISHNVRERVTDEKVRRELERMGYA